ncbi:CDP-glucose 4,6-dehydratase [Amylibacter sp.]|nr:CDP-glucose 4,6-dehydratase [Amylibacter sp.]MDB4095645.1 CDP-glucose 4,6-dehydratase [Amylibacter sp.]
MLVSFKGIKILVTGHTGFKGSWLCELLLELGANVAGLSLPITYENKLFSSLDLEHRIQHYTGDVRDSECIDKLISQIRPDIILHLAAQPLVITGYQNPKDTFTTNINGTLNLLEAVKMVSDRDDNWRCTVVNVTTDKVYENQEWSYTYRENDKLGGHDPYSSSKAANELIAQAYQQSFFHENSRVNLICARAGNVIGGGDFANHRLIPDCIRAYQSGVKLEIRNPLANRPWQHVLDPLWGYIKIAHKSHSLLTKCEGNYRSTKLGSAYNFGPNSNSVKDVYSVIDEVRKYINIKINISDAHTFHEAQNLSLSYDKAFQDLQWSPQWGFQMSIKKTINWYLKVDNNMKPRDAVLNDIKNFLICGL